MRLELGGAEEGEVSAVNDIYTCICSSHRSSAASRRKSVK